MQTTPSLELSGLRRTARRASAWVIAGLAALAAVGYLLPAHKLSGHEWHSTYADGGLFSFAVLVLVMGAVLALRKRRLGSGMLAGALSIGGALAAVVPVFLEHMFSHVDRGIGDDAFALGIVGMFVAGSAMFLGEPVLYFIERRRMRAAQLPVARVIA